MRYPPSTGEGWTPVIFSNHAVDVLGNVIVSLKSVLRFILRLAVICGAI